MKKLLSIAMVLMLSACYPVPTHKVQPVLMYEYQCVMEQSGLYFGDMMYLQLGWYYDRCRGMWFPRRWYRERIYEPRYIPVPPRRDNTPPVQPREPQRRREEIRPPREQERKPEVRQPERRPETRQPERRAEPREPQRPSERRKSN